MTNPAGLLMSLSDVAELAGVRRPVATVWRSRPRRAGQDAPFPTAVVKDGATELFSAGEVVDWLERTGRGNNPEPRADLAAHVRLPAVGGARVSPVDAAEALLCLRVVADTPVGALSAEAILDLADEFDPDDEILYREVEAAGDDAPGLGAYVDRLVDAAFNAGNALTVLDRRRPRAGSTVQMALTDEARQLVGDVTAALALDLARDVVTVEDATGQAADLVDAAVSALGERVDVEIVIRGDTQQARAGRRRQLIRGRRLLAHKEAGVVLARLPTGESPAMSGAEILQTVDELQLALTDADRVVVIGPASVLCDALSDKETEALRDSVLRLGRLRCAVRLPQGLLVGSPRRSLGLWVLGPEAQDVTLEDRLTTTADLTDVNLTPSARSDLATDVVASLGSRQLLHGFRFAHAVRTAEILARSGRLVPLGARPARPHVAAAAEVLTLRRLARDAGMDGVVRVSPAREPRMPALSVGDALRSGQARVLPGARLMAEPFAAGALRLLGASALADGGDPVLVDAIEFSRRHAQAARTEVGDVVFVTSPRPRAMVDKVGLSVVAYPARVLRLADGSGLVPEAVVRAINALPATSRAWRGWLLPRVAAAQVEHVSASLERLEAEEAVLRRRLTGLEALGDAMAPTVAGGAAVVSLYIAESHGNNEPMRSRESDEVG